MRDSIKKLGISTTIVAMAFFGGTPLASAITTNTSANGQSTYQANLAPLNNSGATAIATVTVNSNNTLTVHVDAKGVSPNLPHAQHIHIGGMHTCPTSAADVPKDNNLITTASGIPFYGVVKVSLVTSGDDSASSAVAVSRFPMANADGTYNYTETLTLPNGVTASDIANGVLVIHGNSELFGNPNKYDGTLRSSIDPSLPLEATIPVACGKLTSFPTGSANTGSGSTAGLQHSSELIGGATAIFLAGGALFFNRKLTNRR